MRRRIDCILLSLAFCAAGFHSETANAQLRGEKNFSVINYLGRFHGIGYSDGYHACPDGDCTNSNHGHQLRGLRQNSGSNYQLFDAPSTVANPNQNAPFVVQDRFLGLRQNNVASEIPSSTIFATPMLPVPPEAVRPVPASPLSPSDSNPRMRQAPSPLPPPVPEPVAQPNGVPTAYYGSSSANSLPPGMHSLLRQHYAPQPRY